jgi:GAF domain-containing protein
MQDAGMSFCELLVVPMYRGDHAPVGAIWIVSHDTHRTFDAEDARIMTALAAHTVAALAAAPA